MNMIAGITTLDEPEQFLATIKTIEIAVCSVRKFTESKIDNKDFEESVNNTLEVLVMFRDQMVKRQAVFIQEKWPKKPSAVNIITNTVISKSEVCTV